MIWLVLTFPEAKIIESGLRSREAKKFNSYIRQSPGELILHTSFVSFDKLCESSNVQKASWPNT